MVLTNKHRDALYDWAADTRSSVVQWCLNWDSNPHVQELMEIVDRPLRIRSMQVETATKREAVSSTMVPEVGFEPTRASATLFNQVEEQDVQL